MVTIQRNGEGTSILLILGVSNKLKEFACSYQSFPTLTPVRRIKSQLLKTDMNMSLSDRPFPAILLLLNKV